VAVAEEGKDHGVQVRTEKTVGHRDSGFFAVVEWGLKP